MRFFRNLSLLGKFSLFSGLISLLLLGTIAISYYDMRGIQVRFERFVERYQSLMLTVTGLYAQGLQTEQALRNITLRPSDTQAAANYEKANQEFKGLLAKGAVIAAGVGDYEERLRRLMPMWKELEILKQEIITLNKAGKREQAIALIASKETPAWREVKDRLLAVELDLVKDLARERQDLIQFNDRSFYRILMILGATFLLINILLFVFWELLSNAMNGMVESLRDIAVGETDLSRRLDENGRDEIAMAAHWHNEFLCKLQQMTDELRLARDSANSANQAKSMFLANTSHEIRTPMNAVLGFAQLLERDPSLSPAARNKVSTIMKSGDHLLGIINDILEMSRIEAGRIEVHTESVDLHSLLNDLAAMFRMRSEGKGLAFVLESAPDLSRYIVTDLSKLRQILVNLLGNAVKYTKTGSITMRAFLAGVDRIAIEVQDSGIGISPEEQAKLFRPFERTKSGEQAAGGTGLGLAISREYAHLIDGEITVSSVTGEGSCFRLEFHAPMTSVAPASAKASQRIIGLAPGQGELRILLADDVSINRDLLREILEPLGFIVDEAAEGEEAIRKVQVKKPRIILMDLVMPGMGGIEATQILRRTFSNESLAIIGITASAFGDDKQKFLDAGLNAYLSKPFREQELFDLLSGHAGVVFEYEEDEVLPTVPQQAEIPVLDKMSAEWCQALQEALARKNITRIRKLGDDVKEVDPVLSSWIVERAGRYDLDGLQKLASFRR